MGHILYRITILSYNCIGIKKGDDSWVKKGAQPNDDEGQLPVEGDSSLLQSILDRFDGLQTYVGERFDALEQVKWFGLRWTKSKRKKGLIQLIYKV